MKKLYVSQSLIDVESRKELLDQALIPATIKNQRSAMLGGEVPFVEVFPELWVLKDEDFERAQTLLKDWEHAKPLETTGMDLFRMRGIASKRIHHMLEMRAGKAVEEFSWVPPKRYYVLGVPIILCSAANAWQVP